MSSAELDRDRQRDRYGLRPDPVEHRDGGGFVTSYGSATYGNNRYTPATGYGNRDRISVGMLCVVTVKCFFFKYLLKILLGVTYFILQKCFELLLIKFMQKQKYFKS